MDYVVSNNTKLIDDFQSVLCILMSLFLRLLFWLMEDVS